jgi:hypothetical protein
MTELKQRRTEEYMTKRNLNKTIRSAKKIMGKGSELGF